MQNLDIGESLDEKMIILDALDRDTSSLADIVVSMHHTTEDLVAAHISSLGKHNPEIQKLLSYFKPQLRAIVGGVLSTKGDGGPKLLSILEECYMQSLDDSGALCCDRYFSTLKEAALQSPHDPNHQSVEHYEHEDRMQVDRSYAVTERICRDMMYWRERRQEESIKGPWICFWSNSLRECPGGPTLFVPGESFCPKDPPRAPRYLFRAFDSDSSGLSNDTVVASAASMHFGLVNRLSLLSISKRKATLRMHEHLEKSLFGGLNSDNLMSWSSSLLFVIQYAIWRSEK